MPKAKPRKKKPPKRVLALPDLEHTKTAVLNSLTSASGQRTYEHAIREFVVRSPASRSIAQSCSGTGFTSNNADMRRPRSIFGWPPSGASRTRHSTPAYRVLNSQPVYVALRVYGGSASASVTG
jgi:hypothetical protein